MSAPGGGASGGAPASGGSSGGGQATPNATVGNVHSRTPLGAIPGKATPKQLKRQAAKPSKKAPPKRKR